MAIHDGGLIEHLLGGSLLLLGKVLLSRPDRVGFNYEFLWRIVGLERILLRLVVHRGFLLECLLVQWRFLHERLVPWIPVVDVLELHRGILLLGMGRKALRILMDIFFGRLRRIAPLVICVLRNVKTLLCRLDPLPCCRLLFVRILVAHVRSHARNLPRPPRLVVDALRERVVEVRLLDWVDPVCRDRRNRFLRLVEVVGPRAVIERRQQLANVDAIFRVFASVFDLDLWDTCEVSGRFSVFFLW